MEIEILLQVTHNKCIQFKQFGLYVCIEYLLRSLIDFFYNLIQQPEVVDEAYYLLDANFESIIALCGGLSFYF
jgi:hypothetical protein